jgi:hypothetical protein
MLLGKAGSMGTLIGLILLICLIFVQPFGLDGCAGKTAKCKSVVMQNVKVGVAPCC